MFEKKRTIFRKKDAQVWKQMKKVLKEEGFKGMHVSHVYAESQFVCGCGAQLDPRDFGPKGKIDRDIYFINVPEKDADRAVETLKKHGLVPTVETYQ